MWERVRVTNLISNQFLQQLMTRNRKQETGEEHAQRDDNGSCKRVAKRAISQVCALKPDKRCEDDEWCGQYVADGDGVNEDALW